MRQKQGKNDNSNRRSTITAVSVVGILVSGTVTAAIIVNSPNKNYFGHDAQIVSSFSASEYEGVMTPSQVESRLEELGFDNSISIACYSIKGEYIGEETIQVNDTEKHPTYDIEYEAASGDVWMIYIYGDQIMANPVTYNLNSSRDVRILISEKETLTSYNSDENAFYEIIPADSELLVFTVDSINAEVLDNLTQEALDEL